jgi:hypothetical protein
MLRLLLAIFSSSPYSELPLLDPSLPELELAFVWTRSRLLVELNLFANSWKESLLTLVLLLLFSFGSRSGAAKPESLREGMVVAEIDLEGSARELGRELRWEEEFVPVRGRSPPPLE